MELRDYLHKKRISITEFARQINVSRTHLGRIVNNKLKPGKRLAKDIERLTDGCVTTCELLEEEKDVQWSSPFEN